MLHTPSTEERKALALDAAQLGRLVKLVEHSIEAFSTPKQTKKDSWALKEAMDNEIRRSNHFQIIHEAAAMGKLKKGSNSKELAYESSGCHNSDDASHATFATFSTSASSLVGTGINFTVEQQQQDPTAVLAVKQTPRQNQRGRVASLLVEEHLLQLEKDKALAWAPLTALEEQQEQQLTRHKWKAGGQALTLPTRVLPKFVKPNCDEHGNCRYSHKQLTQRLAQEVAETVFDRLLRIEQKHIFAVRTHCACPYCVHPTPYQTHRYQQLQKLQPQGVDDVLPTLLVPTMARPVEQQQDLDHHHKTLMLQDLVQVAQHRNRHYWSQTKTRPHVTDTCDCVYCENPSAEQTKSYLKLQDSPCMRKHLQVSPSPKIAGNKKKNNPNASSSKTAATRAAVAPIPPPPPLIMMNTPPSATLPKKKRIHPVVHSSVPAQRGLGTKAQSSRNMRDMSSHSWHTTTTTTSNSKQKVSSPKPTVQKTLPLSMRFSASSSRSQKSPTPPSIIPSFVSPMSSRKSWKPPMGPRSSSSSRKDSWKENTAAPTTPPSSRTTTTTNTPPTTTTKNHDARKSMRGFQSQSCRHLNSSSSSSQTTTTTSTTAIALPPFVSPQSSRQKPKLSTTTLDSSVTSQRFWNQKKKTTTPTGGVFSVVSGSKSSSSTKEQQAPLPPWVTPGRNNMARKQVVVRPVATKNHPPPPNAFAVTPRLAKKLQLEQQHHQQQQEANNNQDGKQSLPPPPLPLSQQLPTLDLDQEDDNENDNENDNEDNNANDNSNTTTTTTTTIPIKKKKQRILSSLDDEIDEEALLHQELGMI